MTIRDDIIKAASTFPPLPYRLDPPPDGVNNVDCSLYVQQVFDSVGIALPRTAEQQRQASTPIDFADVLPGDLLFFENTYPAGEGVASHVGISLGTGTGQMWDAHERSGNATAVGLTNIRTPYWQGKISSAGRPPGLGATVDDGDGTPDEQPWGIDVASHQGSVDWRQVAAAGAAFSFTKATGGAWYRNPTLEANWAGMKAAGIKRGAYHYAFESSGQPFPGPGPEAEAEHFLNAVLPLGFEAGDMLVLDIEEGQGPLGEWVLRWCQRVEQRTGSVPLVYTGTWFRVPHGLGDVPELAKYPLWLAAYTDEMPEPPAPWSRVAFWQHTDSLSVPGVASPCDGNLFNGPADMLKLYGKPGAATGPAIGVPDSDELGSLRNLVGNGFHEDGVVIPALVNAQKNGDWSQVEAVVKWLRENNPHRAA